MSTPALILLSWMQRTVEGALVMYLDIEDVLRFFLEQSGTNNRIRQLVQRCGNRLSRQRRSCVRYLASFIPIKPCRRMFLQAVDPVKQTRPTCLTDKMNDNHNPFSNLDWLDHTLDNCGRGIRHRTSLSGKSTDYICNQSGIESVTVGRSPNASVDGPRSSTPISFLENPKTVHRLPLSIKDDQDGVLTCIYSPPDTSGSVKTIVQVIPDALTQKKIMALEDELVMLRQQIAGILSVQERMAKTTTTGTQPSGLPPPPPPPPPPPMPQFCSGGHNSLRDQINLNKKSTTGKKKSIHTTATGSVPNMTEVLKGMNKVKLRPIQRSPGGTPIRPPKIPSDDPTAMLARALRKRFARLSLESPQKDQYDDSHSLSSFATPSPNPVAKSILCTFTL